MDKYRAGIMMFGIGCCAAICLGAGPQADQAKQLWQKGQAAMEENQPDRAIGYYEASLRLDPSFAKNHMSLAAAYLEKGDDARSCMHLARYLDSHPDHHLMRTHYAELLLRLGRVEMAQLEFTRFLRDTEDQEATFMSDWIYCHRRLMEIAAVNDDPYHVHLHRGIALYLMSQKHAQLSDPDGELSTEGLLFKAASDLSIARLLHKDCARPYWYLHLVWSKLGQSKQAIRYLRETRERILLDDLTPGEQRGLMLCQD